ncbi:hypothetical protein GCM10022247_36130 [Allokutzneria multivorans]|uniref:Uncharacterized protein n=1 Tax=Allokutzneria multivorans TaxID=1142134 RepID=A0ABP7SEC3_9PSEU
MARGLHVDLTHQYCDIHTIAVTDYVPHSTPRLYRGPSGAPTAVITLGHDGWVLPKAGVHFTWTLNREL